MMLKNGVWINLSPRGKESASDDRLGNTFSRLCMKFVLATVSSTMLFLRTTCLAGSPTRRGSPSQRAAQKQDKPEKSEMQLFLEAKQRLQGKGYRLRSVSQTAVHERIQETARSAQPILWTL